LRDKKNPLGGAKVVEKNQKPMGTASSSSRGHAKVVLLALDGIKALARELVWVMSTESNVG
jgi:hypothetical protein